MPLNNNSSYIPTMNEFIAHWTQVNDVLPAPLVIKGPDGKGVTLVDFTQLRDLLQVQVQTVTNFLSGRQIARGDIEKSKAKMLAQLKEFTGLLEGYWGDTPFIRARPYAPSVSDGQETFLSPMRDTLSLWTNVNAAPAPEGMNLPLTLSDGTVVENFQMELNGLQQAYAAEAKINQDLVLARSKRDMTMAKAKAIMVTYRKVVPARCAQFPELVQTLPAVTPLPGHTPQPVNASAVFEEPDLSKVIYDASTEPTLARYELRGNPGNTYSDEDSVVISTHSATDPREFLTNFGLTQPGTQVALKVYVILTTGNEAGGAAMVVTRPG